jgi:hypothetical protein
MDKWEVLKGLLKTETDNMQKAAGEQIVEIKPLSEFELVLVHRKTFKRLRLTFSKGMDSLRVEDSSGKARFERFPDFLPSLAVDLLQKLS